MKKVIIIQFIAILLCLTTHAKDKDFEKAIKEISKAHASADSIAINKYIHPQKGFIVVYKTGLLTRHFLNKDPFSFSSRLWPQYYTKTKEKYSGIKYENLPQFICEGEDGEGWTKENGLYVDTLKIDRTLSDDILFSRKAVVYPDDQYTMEYYNKIVNLEERSRRIVWVYKNGDSAMFYLTKIKGRWYITLIDRFTDDCSA